MNSSDDQSWILSSRLSRKSIFNYIDGTEEREECGECGGMEIN